MCIEPFDDNTQSVLLWIFNSRDEAICPIFVLHISGCNSIDTLHCTLTINRLHC